MSALDAENRSRSFYGKGCSFMSTQHNRKIRETAWKAVWETDLNG